MLKVYTNIDIDRTIQFILEEIYPEGSPPKIDIPKVSLQALLELCTKEAPFVSPDGRMFRQIDGVAMGSPLGVLFANFFIGRIERDVFSIQQKPRIYARYIDDIFVLAKDDDELQHLHHCLQEASGLNLSVENSSDGCLPFLDILVNQQPHGFYTKVFCPSSPLILDITSACDKCTAEGKSSAALLEFNDANIISTAKRVTYGL
ncbi:uncharacterized protein LOC143041788 [Oratosquilla oratoria]|uniref:uncharacterized protein LOC143041788 n=1 Tax=Oratosquilla oratoria TaxID=337810 RepID=UPI003F77194B